MKQEKETPLNPFEYDAATNLPKGLLLDYYIEDFNYSRFLQSSRNVFLIGERGSGKTMTLLYNSWPVQLQKAKRDGEETLPLKYIGVYVPCNTPLTHKKEYQLLGDFLAAVISEHFLVLSFAYAIAETLKEIPLPVDEEEDRSIRSELEFIFGEELPSTSDPESAFASVTRFLQRELVRTQQTINKRSFDHEELNTFSFASVILPILNTAKRLPLLRKSHFSLMVDDAHVLNEHQMRSLNSYIAYRDHSVFSFKVAAAKIDQRKLTTSAGGSILEGHDYFRVDMEQVFQNEFSDFGRLASSIIQRRLARSAIGGSPEEFFPISEEMKRGLEESEARIREEGVKRYGGEGKSVSDYVYKYRRVHYFRSRSSKANRPPYSGFGTLVYLSTGVIRNLLEPCYWMYDRLLSLQSAKESDLQVIPPHVQAEVILDRSRRLWDRLREGLDYEIEGCSRDDAERAYRLLDSLAVLFRERLLKHASEPAANSFTISGRLGEQEWEDLRRVLDVLRKAQYLYARSGAAKDKGKRELYYVPNRMLWPERGLDPYGQHARVSIGANELWLAATEGKAIPMKKTDDDQQARLWNG